MSLFNLLDTIIKKVNSSVKTEIQEFTDEEKKQVKENLGISENGVPNGVATLDENGKVPVDQLPDNLATTSDLENAITSIDNSLSTAIGSGVLE